MEEVVVVRSEDTPDTDVDSKGEHGIIVWIRRTMSWSIHWMACIGGYCLMADSTDLSESHRECANYVQIIKCWFDCSPRC